MPLTGFFASYFVVVVDFLIVLGKCFSSLPLVFNLIFQQLVLKSLVHSVSSGPFSDCLLHCSLVLMLTKFPWIMSRAIPPTYLSILVLESFREHPHIGEVLVLFEKRWLLLGTTSQGDLQLLEIMGKGVLSRVKELRIIQLVRFRSLDTPFFSKGMSTLLSGAIPGLRGVHNTARWEVKLYRDTCDDITGAGYCITGQQGPVGGPAQPELCQGRPR
ncbi:hypothetical protein Tco_0305271 [Tanacetum coccineum]